MDKVREIQKNICFIDYTKAFDCVIVTQLCPALWLHGLDSPWNSPGQNTGVGSHSLLQGIFPTQGWKPGLPHCRQVLYKLGHREANLTVWIVTNWKIHKEVGIPDHLTYLLRNSMWVKKQLLEPDVEQQTGSKLGKEYNKAVFCHLSNFTYVYSTSCKMPDWMNHKLESRLPGEISTTADVQMIPS